VTKADLKTTETTVSAKDKNSNYFNYFCLNHFGKDAENIQQKIEELREELHQHNYNYYILDEPSISDFEFDAKLKELQDLEQRIQNFMMPIHLVCVLVVA
jgi:hypothetical protein